MNSSVLAPLIRHLQHLHGRHEISRKTIKYVVSFTQTVCKITELFCRNCQSHLMPEYHLF